MDEAGKAAVRAEYKAKRASIVKAKRASIVAELRRRQAALTR